jgi:nucleoside-diphosphate-sugar epimerase
LELNRIAVIGATGPTGIHLVRELASRGRSVLAVSRRREGLEELFGHEEGVEIATADALDSEAIGRVVEDSGLVIDCIGLPADRMADHPKTAQVISRAARTAGARCLQISSYWSFFPHEGEVVNEDHPRRGGHEWFRLRREAEDVMLAAGAAVVHLPDFFGPHVHTSTVQMALEQAVAGMPVSWLGRSNTPRETAYLPDAVRIVADLAEREEAYGTDWGVPGSGSLTADRLAEIASEHLGRPVVLRAAPGWLLKILSLVHPAVRKFRPIIPHYVRPVRYDTSRLRGLLGEVRTTPFEEAIPATLDWIAADRG